MKRLCIFALGVVCAVAALGSGGAAADETIDETLEKWVGWRRMKALEAPRADRPQLVHLGRRLFHDPVLSGNRDISCASCHHPSAGSADALPFSIGTGGRGIGRDRRQNGAGLTRRSAPPIFNLGQSDEFPMFWDGRVNFSKKSHSFETPEPGLNGYHPLHPEKRHPIARAMDSSLAAQALFPVVDFKEMRGRPGENEIADAKDNFEAWARLMDRLGGDTNYRRLFSEAYPEVTAWKDFNFGHAAQAIAAFERQHFQAIDTPFDRYLRGDRSAMTDQEKLGAVLFLSKGRCVQCHSGPMLSEGEFFSVGVPHIGTSESIAADDLGRAEVTQTPWEPERYEYAFRAPPLRNVALTAPYMHNGSLGTLREVVIHYINANAGLRRYELDSERFSSNYESEILLDRNSSRMERRAARIDGRLQSPVPLSAREVDALVAFLENGLTDPAWRRRAEEASATPR